MSNDIKVDDLVMIVNQHPHCGATTYMGAIFTVTAVSNKFCASCKYCGQMYISQTVYGYEQVPNGIELARLKKIDPPSEGETREAYVNLKQPRKVTA